MFLLNTANIDLFVLHAKFFSAGWQLCIMNLKKMHKHHGKETKSRQRFIYAAFLR